MGLYFAVVNRDRKEYIYDPAGNGVKLCSVLSKENGLSRLLLWKMAKDWGNGERVEVVSDDGRFPWWFEEESWKNITDQTIADFNEYFKHSPDQQI